MQKLIPLLLAVLLTPAPQGTARPEGLPSPAEFPERMIEFAVAGSAPPKTHGERSI